MKDITIGQAQKMTAPAPFALLSACDGEGKTNLMAVSWWTYLSNHPPKLGACLSNKGYSGGLIRESGEFAVNVVDESLKEAALMCGRSSGRATDKIAEFGIGTVDASEIKAKLVAESKVSFECRLTDALDIGDHTIYIGDIIAIHGDESKKQLYAFDGYARLDTV